MLLQRSALEPTNQLKGAAGIDIPLKQLGTSFCLTFAHTSFKEDIFMRNVTFFCYFMCKIANKILHACERHDDSFAFSLWERMGKHNVETLLNVD